MTINEALEFIHSVSWLGSVPGLERIRELLHRIGDPQKRVPVVHIAGTNGKGSAAASLASVLTAAGYVTGLCTSPYIFRFNERMQCCGHEITDEELCAITEFIKPHAEAMAHPPTEFELVCAVIMNIGLDHTRELGSTVEAIAAEKAGIIKPGCDVVLYTQKPSVMDVIRAKCRQENCPLFITDPNALKVLPGGIGRLDFIYRGKQWSTPLLGAHQAKNAAVVLETVARLRTKGYVIPEEAVRRGLETVRWPARFEIIAEKPWFVVDGGHNPQCAETVADNIRRYFPNMHVVLLTGVLADKDYNSLTNILAPTADCFVAVTPNCPRALPAQDYARHLEKYGKPVSACGSIPEGVAKARALAGKDGVVVAVGSLYMAGPIRDCFGLE